MTVWLDIGGKKRRVELPTGTRGGSVAECMVDGRPLAVDVCHLQAGVMSLVVDGRQYRCVLDGNAVVIGWQRFEFSVNDPRLLQTRRGTGAGSDGPQVVKAPMPGRVVRVLVGVGDKVVEGQPVVVIEAMKMQNELRSPKTGHVVRMAAVVGGAVGLGDTLAVIE